MPHGEPRAQRGRAGGDGSRAQEPRRRGQGRPRRRRTSKRWSAASSNLRRHLRNIREVWGLRPVVALNRFTSDTDAEIELVRRAAAETGAKVALCEVWAKGGEGGRELAKLVMEEASHADPAAFTFTYPDEHAAGG